MAVEVTIKSKGLFKKSLNVKDVILEDMRYGIMDEAFRLEENKIGQFIVAFPKDHICRGIEISLNKSEVNLRMPLPTSNKDIEFFYDYIKQICTKLHTKEFLRENEKATFDEIEQFIDLDIDASKNALIRMREEIEKDATKNIYLFGAVNPICIGKEELDEIDNSPRRFGELMNRLQSLDVYYARPVVFQKKDETLFGAYSLTENIPSVLPTKPQILMANENMKVTEWYISFVYDNKIQGDISYNDFLKELEKTDYYDTEHFIISLDKEKMKKLLEKYKTTI